MTDSFQFDDSDIWAWWREACEHPERIGTPALPLHEGELHPGFYRVRKKGGQWEPVHIWRNDFGAWQASRSGRGIDDLNRINDLWLWCARAPVTEDAYDKATAGKGWDDEPPLAPGIGHNIEADELDKLRIEYLGEAEAAREILKTPLRTKTEADRAAIWANRLQDIKNKADALHKVEKAPVLDEYRRIDDRWRELREDTAALAKRLKLHGDAWLQEQDRLERQRVAAARAEADRLKREAEEAARLAVSPQAILDAGAKVHKAQVAQTEAEYQRPQIGRTNAKVTLKKHTSAQIDDWDTLFTALSGNAEMRALAKTLADRAAKAGNPYPGTTIHEEMRPSL